MKRLIITILILTSLNSIGQKCNRVDYINKFKALAIKEMKRVGIPASITLAQGLLESGNGNSTLARKANNHFGIKCHNDWKGPYMLMDDDKPNEKFRKYSSAKKSYYDHSNFLSTKNRYAFLFNYSVKDYKSWAKGLKKAGYATAKDYAPRLIRIIEDERLYRYDNISDSEYKRILANNFNKNKFEARKEIANGKFYIAIEKGDSLYSIAKYFDISVNKLLRFNDITNKNNLKIGQKIYVQRKRRKAASGYDYHLVRKGDNLYSIAQEYAIKLKMLYKFNYLKKGQEPKAGDRIYMRGKAPLEF
jgi:LysM repeat protein